MFTDAGDVCYTLMREDFKGYKSVYVDGRSNKLKERHEFVLEGKSDLLR
jgi:hypothetical protein